MRVRPPLTLPLKMNPITAKYEAHITVKEPNTPEVIDKLQKLAIAIDWRYSRIDGDPKCS